MKIYFDDPESDGQFLALGRLRAAGRTDRRGVGDCRANRGGRRNELVKRMVVLCRGRNSTGDRQFARLQGPNSSIIGRL